jgi:hypothetical protein
MCAALKERGRRSRRPAIMGAGQTTPGASCAERVFYQPSNVRATPCGDGEDPLLRYCCYYIEYVVLLCASLDFRELLTMTSMTQPLAGNSDSNEEAAGWGKSRMSAQWNNVLCPSPCAESKRILVPLNDNHCGC